MSIALNNGPHFNVPPDVDEDEPDNVGRKRAQALGIADRLDIVGRVPIDELVRLYQRATLVAVPSRYEGFGLPAVEAMACGTPVVACRSGALPEVIEVGGGGLLVERDDPDSIAAGIRSLLEKHELRANLAARGRDRVVAAVLPCELAPAFDAFDFAFPTHGSIRRRESGR